MRNKDLKTIDWIDQFCDEVTQIKLRQNFKYNENTGELISKKSGKPVGCLDKSTGYIRYRYMGRNHRLHKLIWLYLYGVVPSGFIVDHIDNDRTNNRKNNLRLATHQHNTHNIKKGNSTNRIGLRGVSQCGNSFIARIMVNNKSVLIGSFASADQASDAYFKVKSTLHKGYVDV